MFCAIFGTDVDMDKFISICRNNDFRRLYAKGKSFVSPLVVVYVKKTGTRGSGSVSPQAKRSATPSCATVPAE